MASSPFGHATAYMTDPDDTNGFALQLDAGEAFAVPFAFLNGLMSLRNVTGHGQHHADGVFCGCNGVGIRCIYHNDTSCRSRWNVDIIHANTGPTDDLQVGSSVDDFLGHLCLAACHQTIVFADAF